MRRIIGFLAVVTMLMGCTLGEIFADYGDAVSLRAEDVSGTWQSGTGNGARLITFNADGTFAALHLPNLHSSFPPDDFRFGAGTWDISEGRQNEIKLHFDRLGDREDVGLGASTEAYRQGDGPVLLFFFDFGSGAGHVTYERCAESACDPVSATPPPRSRRRNRNT